MDSMTPLHDLSISYRQILSTGASMQMIARSLKITVSIGLAIFSTVAASQEKSDTFPHGVASGEVTASSAIVWTRTEQRETVKLEISTDAELKGQDTFHQTVIPSSDTDF